MHKVTVENYRCFREEQTARLAPLTLLVGENSTGKTSFLAMIRALWQVAFDSKVPDFQEPPYDMGTFSEIAHNRGRGSAASFGASFERSINNVRGRRARPGDSVTFEVTFGRKDGVPYPTTRRLYDSQQSIEVAEDHVHARVSERKFSGKLRIGRSSDDNELVPLQYAVTHLSRPDWSEDSGDPEQDKPQDSFSDVEWTGFPS
jgi:predicted ATPase